MRGTMSRILILVLFAATAFAQPPSTLLINAKTGGIVMESHAHVQRFPASLTKLMTLYIAFEKIKKGELKLKDRIRFSRRCCKVPSFKLYLKPGSTITVIDAILAMAVRSANDAAVALGEHIGGCESNFAKLMNQKAKELGMTHTVFKNASGLPNRHQVSTAYDMSRLAKAILDHHPEYSRIFSAQYFLFRGKQYKNTNRLLGTMKGVDGMKTGYTRAAGWNLITTYTKGKEKFIGVVMGEKTKNRRDLRMQHLLEGRKLSDQEVCNLLTKPPSYMKGKTPLSKWGVQVGVFKNSRQARIYGQKVKKKNLQLLKDYTYRIVSRATRRAKVFKTRFNVHSKIQAHEICQSLKDRGVACFVVSG